MESTPRSDELYAAASAFFGLARMARRARGRKPAGRLGLGNTDDLLFPIHPAALREHGIPAVV